MCLMIIWVNQERFDHEAMRIEERYRRRYPRLMTWLLGPQASPPQYDEASLPQPKNAKLITQRPDSLTLPKYCGLRKHVDVQIGKKMDGPQEANAK